MNMLLLLLNLAVTTAKDMQPYIVGGQEVSIKNWPFIAFIEMTMSSFYLGACGGSLISSQTVLTAAHCLDDFTKKKTKSGFRLRIYMGHSSYAKASMSRRVLDYETPQKYDPDDAEVRYDIGVMFLVRPVQFSAKVQKVILQKNFNCADDKHLVVAGWGNTDPEGIGGTSKRLKAIKMVYKKYSKCKHFYKVICTSASDNAYPYTGDSGGPLVNAKNHRQVGIVSFRDPNTGISAFTSIPEYFNWIQKAQLKLFKTHCKKGN